MSLVRLENGKVDYETTYKHCHERHESYQRKNWGKHFFSLWKHLLFPKAEILELGCGNGKLCEKLYESNYDVTGIDVAVGPYKRTGYRFIPFDITYTPWPFVDHSFDLGLAFDVFEHIEEIDLDKVLREFFRVSISQVASIPDCRGMGKLHVLIRPADWWLEKLISFSDENWRLIHSEPRIHSDGACHVFIRKCLNEA